MHTTLVTHTWTKAKPWYKSVVVWANVGTLVAMVLGALVDNALQLHIPREVVFYMGLALAVVNTAVRMLRTSQPLALPSMLRRFAGGRQA